MSTQDQGLRRHTISARTSWGEPSSIKKREGQHISLGKRQRSAPMFVSQPSHQQICRLSMFHMRHRMHRRIYFKAFHLPLCVLGVELLYSDELIHSHVAKDLTGIGCRPPDLHRFDTVSLSESYILGQ